MTPTRLAGTALLLAAVFAASGCSASGPPTGAATTASTGGELALIGGSGFGFEDLGLDLEDLGYDVSADGTVSSTTDLVLLVVNAQDGPMPPTLRAVEALAGSVLPRVAIALTDVDAQTDPEIEQLVVRESTELLARYGITPMDSKHYIRWPGTDIASTIQVHLRRAPRDYEVRIPVVTTPTYPATLPVENFAGVPMTDAMEILASQGLVGEVLADPDFGVVSECDPLVISQVPAAGTVVSSGSTVGLLVAAPDRVDPAMAGCLLPALTRAEVDARVAEITAQPLP